MATETRAQQIARSQKKNVQQIKFNFSKNTDADILEYLDASGNRMGTVKAALRERIAGNPYAWQERLVKDGKSLVFESWSELAGVSMMDFLEGLQWLHQANPEDEGPLKPARFLGVSKNGQVVRLLPKYSNSGALSCLKDEDGSVYVGPALSRFNNL